MFRNNCINVIYLLAVRETQSRNHQSARNVGKERRNRPRRNPQDNWHTSTIFLETIRNGLQEGMSRFFHLHFGIFYK